MHELPVTESLYKSVVREAKRAGADRVLAIHLKMGEGCDYIPEIIQQYFDMMSEGTIAAGAKIEAELIPTTITCRKCGFSRRGREFGDACPVCGSTDLKLNISSDFYIENIEIETDDEDEEE